MERFKILSQNVFFLQRTQFVSNMMIKKLIVCRGTASPVL